MAKINKRVMIMMAAAMFASGTFLSCKSDEAVTAGGGSEGESSESGASAKKYRMKDLLAVVRELDAYKKEIGYEMPPAAKELDAGAYPEVVRLMNMKKDHPTLKAIREEGAEAQEMLAQAIQDNDETAKQKWGPIAGQNSLRIRDALETIPEIVQLQKESEERAAKVEELEYQELAKTPKGKELADKLREITKAIQGSGVK